MRVSKTLHHQTLSGDRYVSTHACISMMMMGGFWFVFGSFVCRVFFCDLVSSHINKLGWKVGGKCIRAMLEYVTNNQMRKSLIYQANIIYNNNQSWNVLMSFTCHSLLFIVKSGMIMVDNIDKRQHQPHQQSVEPGS